MDKIELAVDDNWVSHMRLATAEPDRARLLMSGAQRSDHCAAVPLGCARDPRGWLSIVLVVDLSCGQACWRCCRRLWGSC